MSVMGEIVSGGSRTGSTGNKVKTVEVALIGAAHSLHDQCVTAPSIGSAVLKNIGSVISSLCLAQTIGVVGVGIAGSAVLYTRKLVVRVIGVLSAYRATRGLGEQIARVVVGVGNRRRTGTAGKLICCVIAVVGVKRGVYLKGLACILQIASPFR